MKAICAVAIIIFLCVVAAEGQTERKLFPVTENAKFGFADAKGNIVIKPQFDHASNFCDGRAMVEVSGRKGYINQVGAFVVEPQYDDAEDFSGGLAVVSRDYRWGYIDISGKEVIPLQFVEARGFSDGLAAVHTQPVASEQDSKWGYIDTKGDLVISPKFFKAFDFHDGIAKVLVGKFGDDNKQGFINKKGEFVIKPKYELAGEYAEGLIPVEIDGKVEKTGERMYRHISGKWGFIDSSGKLLIPAKFDHADEFSEGLANVTIGKKYGYIDKTGMIVIAPQFEYSSNAYRCANFVEGRACFESDGKIGFIDTKGKVVVEPQFEVVKSFSNGLAQVDFGVYSKSGNVRFPVSDNYGLIDRTGRVIYKPTNQGAAIVSKPEPVNVAQYDGWQRIETKTFSFYAPANVQGGAKSGIDTAVYEYTGPGLRILFDIGMMANSASAHPPHKIITIDGQEAKIWHAANRSFLHIALGANYSKTQFNMIVSSDNSNPNEMAEKMFTSLRFK